MIYRQCGRELGCEVTNTRDVRLPHRVLLGVRYYDPLGVLPVVQWLESIPYEEGGDYAYTLDFQDEDPSKRYVFYFEKSEMACMTKMRWG